MVRELAAALVADTRCGLGESPFWDETTGEIAWLDIEAGTMLRHRDGGEISKVELAPEVTFAAMADDGGIVFADPRGVHHQTATGDLHSLAPSWLDPASARTNDGAVDAQGRIWVGSTTRARTRGTGEIGVVLEGDWQPRFHDLTLPNGIGWSPADDRIYYVDTLSGTLWRAPFDSTDGSTGQPQPFFTLGRDRGLLDGLCVDETGAIWVAIWGGGVVIRIDEFGDVTTTVEVGASAVTSCAFAGTSLFITTADPEGLDRVGVGGLYSVEVGVGGVPIAMASTRSQTPENEP